MAFTLPPLPYAYNALEPHIDEQTMRIHHDKHHATYVNNLERGARAASRPPEEVDRGAAREHRHAPGGDPHAGAEQRRRPRQPHHVLGDDGAGRRARSRAARWPTAINKAFGGFDKFKEQFAKACTGRFGSGWAWLVADAGGGSSIESTPNQDTPLMSGKTADPGLRRVGARVLPEVPESPPGLRDGLVERGELDRRGAAATTRR